MSKEKTELEVPLNPTEASMRDSGNIISPRKVDEAARVVQEDTSLHMGIEDTVKLI